jgi:hypothetical protein
MNWQALAEEQLRTVFAFEQTFWKPFGTGNIAVALDGKFRKII